MASEPKTLQEAVLFFSDPTNVREYLIARRWPNGVECPYCGSTKVKFSEKYNRWQCGSHHAAKVEGEVAMPRQFTLKTGTIFEESPIGLDKWLLTMWQLGNCKNGVSSYEIAKDIGVTQKSAWFMLHRLRETTKDVSGAKLSGEVEADETFVGGKIENMHKLSKRHTLAKTPGTNWNKTIVLGLLQRDGEVRAAVSPSRTKHHVEAHLTQHVEPGAKLYTDELPVYGHLSPEYKREFVNHLEAYVEGRVHTNGIENFWSLLKRSLKGTYVSVDPAHLQAYVDEQAFRFNSRKNAEGEKINDGDRFSTALSKVVGKRLTWDALTTRESTPRTEA
jgi:transposase-like protein